MIEFIKRKMLANHSYFSYIFYLLFSSFVQSQDIKTFFFFFFALVKIMQSYFLNIISFYRISVWQLYSKKKKKMKSTL